MKDSVTEYDFDKPLDRRNGDSLKWNRYAGRDVLPLWVADMDFAAPPAVLATLRGAGWQGPGPDRFLAPEIEYAVRLVASSAVLRAVEAVTGPLA